MYRLVLLQNLNFLDLQVHSYTSNNPNTGAPRALVSQMHKSKTKTQPLSGTSRAIVDSSVTSKALK